MNYSWINDVKVDTNAYLSLGLLDLEVFLIANSEIAWFENLQNPWPNRYDYIHKQLSIQNNNYLYQNMENKLLCR